jgi:hypothetical protein
MAITISDKCAEIMMSNVRPKAEPIIEAKITNPDGTTKGIRWKPKEIKTLTFKYEIDPIGRTRPFMELTWTEVYNENLDFENTKKYLTAQRYMQVTFRVIQNLDFFNNWRSIYNSESTWFDVYRGNNWKKIKNNVLNEKITFPILFLEDKPKIEGLTITWTARDFLSFLDADIKITKTVDESTNFFELPKEVLNSEKNRFLNYREFSDYIEYAAMEFQKLTEADPNVNIPELPPYLTLNENIYVEEKINDFLVNYTNIHGVWLSFPTSKEHSINVNFWHRNWNDREYFYGLPKTKFYKKTMFNSLKKTKNQNISNFNFKWHKFDETNKWSEYDQTEKFNDLGQEYNENNPLNPYRFNNLSADIPSALQVKKSFYNYYFNSELVVSEFECLPNFELLSGDFCDAQIGTGYTNGEPRTNEGIIVSQTLTYNGAFKQKNIVHEIPYTYG